MTRKSIFCAVCLMAFFGAVLLVVALNRVDPTPDLEHAKDLIVSGTMEKDPEKLDEAKVELRKVIANQDSDSARLILADILIKQRAYEEAERYLADVAAERPLGPRARLQEGNASWGQGRFARAERQWRAALELDEEVPEAGWWLLSLYFSQERIADARNLAMKLHGVEPLEADRIQLLWEIIRQEHERMDPEIVQERMNQAVKFDPTDLHSSTSLARSLVRLGKLDEASELTEKLLTDHPENLALWIVKLQILEESGNHEEVLVAYEKAPAVLQDEPAVIGHRARALQGLGRWKEAQSAFERLLERDPFDRKAHYHLYRVLGQLGADAAAEVHLQKSREMDQAREKLGELYQARERRFLTGRLCDELASNCRVLGWEKVAELWESEGRRVKNLQ